MKKKTPSRRSSPERSALASDACPACGTGMEEKRGRLRLPVNGEEISVPAAAHLRCPRCGKVVLRFEDARRLSADAIAIYRRKHGLLSAEDIRAVRKRFGLTQRDLARLLRLGSNTISLGGGPQRPDGGDGRAPSPAARCPGKPRLPPRPRGMREAHGATRKGGWAWGVGRR
jgi:putative zinc finger/helix-turn-helix YgiT family protein